MGCKRSEVQILSPRQKTAFILTAGMLAVCLFSFEFLSSGEFRLVVRRLDGYVVPQMDASIEIVR